VAWTTPRTWLAGEIASAAIFNTHIRDNFNALGPSPVVWTNVSFQNGWSNYDTVTYGPCVYAQVGPFTAVRGLAAGGTAYTTIFQLPAALAPPRQLRFSGATAQQAPRDFTIFSGSGNVLHDSVGDPMSNVWVSVYAIFPWGSYN